MYMGTDFNGFKEDSVSQGVNAPNLAKSHRFFHETEKASAPIQFANA
jgi:hypothetical protein